MKQTNKPSRLFYHQTDTEVLVGDYIHYRSFFGRCYRQGRVSYIPDLTAQELMQSDIDPDEWVIALDDGNFYLWLYSPEDLQPGKRITFVARATEPYQGISPKEIEKAEADILKKETKTENLIGCLLTSLMVVGTLVIVGFVLRWLMNGFGQLLDWLFG